MAGIYIHIPYCRQACTYCNFHFSTHLGNKVDLLKAMHHEIDLRHRYLKDQEIQSLYFGGGTPSLLTGDEIRTIKAHLSEYYRFDPQLEFTLEANPEDLTVSYLDQLYRSGINRLSIGIQSFQEEDMKYMHRSHTPEQSLDAIQNAMLSGIQNISIDLIYGSPSTGMDHWKENLDIAFGQDIKHLSCYALTIEPRTALAHQIATYQSPAPDEDETIQQLEYLMDIASGQGYEHYEISNFAKQDYRSKHNSSYWQGLHYLGLGPAAHSFDGSSRQWNIANNTQYINTMQHGLPYFETEALTPTMKYNEYILTSLRTIEGISLNKIPEPFTVHLSNQIKNWLAQNYLVLEQDHIRLTRPGKFIADRISADLFYS